MYVSALYCKKPAECVTQKCFLLQQCFTSLKDTPQKYRSYYVIVTMIILLVCVYFFNNTDRLQMRRGNDFEYISSVAYDKPKELSWADFQIAYYIDWLNSICSLAAFDIFDMRSSLFICIYMRPIHKFLNGVL